MNWFSLFPSTFLDANERYFRGYWKMVLQSVVNNGRSFVLFTEVVDRCPVFNSIFYQKQLK